HMGGAAQTAPHRAVDHQLLLVGSGMRGGNLRHALSCRSQRMACFCSFVVFSNRKCGRACVASFRCLICLPFAGMKSRPSYQASSTCLSLVNGLPERVFPLQLPSFASCAHQSPDGPYLDATHAGRWNLRGDLDSIVLVGSLNQIEPRQT